MITSIELQVISKILTCDDDNIINELLTYDSSYYSVFKPHIEFILDHKNKFGDIPDVFTFQSQFPDITLVQVNEGLKYLDTEMRKNKQHIILLETFNKVKDLGTGDVVEAWQYISNQCERVSQLDNTQPLDLVKDAKKRADEVLKFSQQTRIPTGFPEIDKLMYGGLSTVEELFLIVARTNSGKSWVCTRMMETAQANGFPVLYYSPEMQASFLGTRFDTWRGHFENSKLYRGNYNEEYYKYLKELPKQETSAFVLEDKDSPSGEVTVNLLANQVRKHGIKLLVVDGLSYMVDSRRSKIDTDYTKYRNICLDLFRLSKQNGCAVVVVMQANRATKDNKDDKGEPMPSLYEVEGSDHPARIATQAISLRQIFDKHVLDIRLEKSRIANNQKPILSYAWDVNTGNVQYLPGGDDDPVSNIVAPTIQTPNITNHIHSSNEDEIVLDDSDDEDVEF